MSSGKVIRTLRASPLQRSLTEAELLALASCGRIQEYGPGEAILQAYSQDERVFVLHHGRVLLHAGIWTEGGQCSGEVSRELSVPGQAFGWGTWMQPDRVTVAAHAMEPASLAALDLQRLKDSNTFWKLSHQMVKELYGWLQESGLCPPNLQALVHFAQLVTAE